MKLKVIVLAMSTLLVGCGNEVIDPGLAQQDEQIKKLQQEVQRLDQNVSQNLPINKEEIPLTEDDPGYEGSVAQKNFEAYYDQCQVDELYYDVGGNGFLCTDYEITMDLIGKWKYGNYEVNKKRHKEAYLAYCQTGASDVYYIREIDGEHRFYCYNYETAVNMIGKWKYESSH